MTLALQVYRSQILNFSYILVIFQTVQTVNMLAFALKFTLSKLHLPNPLGHLSSVVLEHYGAHTTSKL